MSDETKRLLKQCCGDDFLNKLEEYVEFKIPIQIRNALKLNCYDSAIALSKFDERSIGEMESFMKNQFDVKFIPQNEIISDYLGMFENSQTQFMFLGGQTRLFTTLADVCRVLYASHQSCSKANPETQTSQRINHSTDQIDKTIKAMIAQVKVWMQGHSDLVEVIHNELLFTVERSSFIAKADGSVSCILKCPVMRCISKYKVTFSKYSTYYEKKKSKKPQRLRAPRWHFDALKHHLLKIHSTKSEESSTDSSDTTGQQETVRESNPTNSMDSDSESISENTPLETVRQSIATTILSSDSEDAPTIHKLDKEPENILKRKRKVRQQADISVNNIIDNNRRSLRQKN